MCRTSCACLTLRVRGACAHQLWWLVHITLPSPLCLSHMPSRRNANPLSTDSPHWVPDRAALLEFQGRHAKLLGHSPEAQTSGRAGKRLAAVETAALKVLLAKLEVAHALVQTCSEPGEL